MSQASRPSTGSCRVETKRRSTSSPTSSATSCSTRVRPPSPPTSSLSQRSRLDPVQRSSHLAPDRQVRSSAVQHWSGSRLSSSAESSSLEHARRNGNVHNRTSHTMMMMMMMICRLGLVTRLSVNIYLAAGPAYVVQWSNHLGAMCSRA